MEEGPEIGQVREDARSVLEPCGWVHLCPCPGPLCHRSGSCTTEHCSWPWVTGDRERRTSAGGWQPWWVS